MSVPVIETEKTNLELMSGHSKLHILKDVTMNVNSGEVVAVVGPSGSGKTSLLMVLGGLERATSGKVKVAGVDTSTLNEDGLAIFRRKNLGILFQNFHLIPSMTALENVSLALEIAETGMPLKDIRRAAMDALDEVGLADRVTHLPSALSGGEQQRVGLARAMVASPRLMLADEPTGNLDQDTGARVIELMFALARKKNAAVLLITHDRSLAEKADRKMTMNHGHLTSANEPVLA
ncbi:MAG: ABC transporter ATP-binding protein [Devosia sp.]